MVSAGGSGTLGHDRRGLAALALVFNAFTWGVSWWPFRQLEAAGLHPLWQTAITFTVAVAGLLAVRPSALAEVLRTPVLWVLAAAAGTTNACFNWGVTIGDVVRVVLLFYLMPLWAVLLARPLLGERILPPAVLRIVLALAGAVIVLWPAGGIPDLRLTLPDVLGLVGGFSFALNNVMLRREARRGEHARALAMFAVYVVMLVVYPAGMGFGDVKLAGVLGLFLGWVGSGALVVGWFAAFLLGGLYSVGLLVARRAQRRTGIPFGPWMLAGALAGIAAGPWLWNAYLRVFQ